jgi:citrate synthase
MLADRTAWSTGVGDAGHGTITVRGYPLADMIETLPFAASVYLTIRGELPTPAQVRVMEAALNGILEHGFYAPTTVAARVVASATPDNVMAAIAGSLLTVGSITVSPQHAAQLMHQAIALSDKSSLEDAADQVVEELLASGRRMPGVGHPLHPEGDPRAISLRKVAQGNGVWGQHATVFELIAARFGERKGRPFPINIDGMLGCVLTELGFEPLEMPGLAALSFMPGIIAHSVEEIGQGPKLRVVEGDYTGPAPRELPTELGYWSDRSAITT